jgi:predicted Holliday junction resolvase-like endonuclease
MSVMDIVIFILIILALAVALYLLRRSEAKTKNKYKLDAYNLLEEKNPDPKKVKETIKFLHIYGGRFRQDHEFQQLQILLTDLLNEIEKPGKPDRQVKK